MPYIDLAGNRLHYRERGTCDRVALFIHGFPLDSTMWLDQLALLADVRRCIAVDLRGFGLSDPAPGDSVSMAAHADDLALLLQTLGIARADVIGLSMGGYVALAFAQLHGSAMRSLVLVDTRAEADTAEGKAGRDAAAAHVLEDGRRMFGDGLEKVLLGPAPSVSSRGRLRTMIEGTRYETITASLAAMRDRPDRSSILRRVAVPTTVIVGEYDELTPPSAARAMAEAVEGALMQVISGAGHMTPIEAPGEVAAVLRAHLAAVDGATG